MDLGPVEVDVDGEELMACVEEMASFMADRHPIEDLQGWEYDPRVEVRVSGLEGNLYLSGRRVTWATTPTPRPRRRLAGRPGSTRCAARHG